MFEVMSRLYWFLNIPSVPVHVVLKQILFARGVPIVTASFKLKGADMQCNSQNMLAWAMSTVCR